MLCVPPASILTASSASVLQSRLDFAKTLVPSVRTVLVKPGTSPQDVALEIKQAAGLDLSVALECTGVQSSIWAAIHVSALAGLPRALFADGGVRYSP